MGEPTRFFVLKPDSLELGVADDHSVLIRLGGFEKEAGLTPGLGVMIALSANEAIAFADALRRTADEASASVTH